MEHEVPLKLRGLMRVAFQGISRFLDFAHFIDPRDFKAREIS